MGILDYLNSPEAQQLLGISSGLLSAGGPSPYPVSFGQALSKGLLTGNEFAGAARKQRAQDLQAKSMEYGLDAQKRTQAAIEAYAASLPENQRGLFLANPAAYIKSATEGYTLAPGQTRYQGSQPVAASAPNLEFRDTGGEVVGVNPQTGARSVMFPKTVSPDTTARLGFDAFKFGNISATDKERIGIDRLNTYYNTGMGIPGQAPRVAPKLEQELALAAPKAGAKVMGAAQAQAALDLPQAAATADQAVNLIDQMVGGNGKPAHPGFKTSVGATMLPGQRFIPGTEAANFQALLDQVKGGAFLQAFQTLKGGGQITEVEGKKATDAITRMNTSQSEAEFVKAAREYQEVIRKGVERARQRAAGQATQPDAGEFAGYSIRPVSK